MYDLAIVWDWVAFSVRWPHVITAMAWIGASFFFIALDLGLKKAPDMPNGVSGEEWQVHGGGFYHIQKYLVAPQNMPEHLIWHKWKSYIRWVSGAALLMVVYWGVVALPPTPLILVSACLLEEGYKCRTNSTLIVATRSQSKSVGWPTAPRTTPGGQAVYSDLAIELCLTFGMVFKQPLRQT